MQGGSAVNMHDVFLRYGSGDFVLKNINLNLGEKDFYFLTGESGAGKTSLLRLIYLHSKPSRGRVSLFNYDISKVERKDLPIFKRKIGIVFQDYRLINHLSAFENVALPLVVCGAKKKDIKRQVSEILEWVGLKDHMHQPPYSLSGGQQQRVAIARAVINKPDLIIADEPTGNVDPEMAKKLLGLFVEMNKQGTAVVIATHSDELIRKFAFPRYHLNQGALTEFPPMKAKEGCDV